MISDRLKKAFAAGDIPSLMRLLADWTTEELQALVEDINKFHEAGTKDIASIYEQHVFKPEFFFNKERQQLLDEQRDKAFIGLMAVCSEIVSVAYLYLRERGIEIDNEEKEKEDPE